MSEGTPRDFLAGYFEADESCPDGYREADHLLEALRLEGYVVRPAPTVLDGRGGVARYWLFGFLPTPLWRSVVTVNGFEPFTVYGWSHRSALARSLARVARGVEELRDVG